MNRFLLQRVGVAVLVGMVRAHALEFDHANRGTDGEFRPTGTTYVVDLSQAADGPWDSIPPVAGQGVYDAQKWAVVFKFKSVTIPAGTTVVFRNHPTRAPVVWLVEGDADLAGTVELSGADGDGDPTRFGFAEPGPGGFRGGESGMAGAGVSSGFGPGAGQISRSQPGDRRLGAASHSTLGRSVGQSPGPTYGNSRILPLVGGSGGAGFIESVGANGGGAGGGAILLAASGNLTLNGSILANGGTGGFGEWPNGSSSGSGGAIRLVADRILGNGFADARSKADGGMGWVAIECQRYEANLTTFPTVPVDPSGAGPVALWPDATAPEARIVSVSDRAAPFDPRAHLGLLVAPDIRLPEGSGTNAVVIETRNLPTNAVVRLRVAPRHGAASWVGAAFLSTTPEPERLLWLCEIAIPPGFHALQVLAQAP